jgi:hypothetical protein
MTLVDELKELESKFYSSDNVLTLEEAEELYYQLNFLRLKENRLNKVKLNYNLTINN